MVYISKFLAAVRKSGNENSHCYACYFLAFRDGGWYILFKLCDCFRLVQLNVYVNFFFRCHGFYFYYSFFTTSLLFDVYICRKYHKSSPIFMKLRLLLFS